MESEQRGVLLEVGEHVQLEAGGKDGGREGGVGERERERDRGRKGEGGREGKRKGRRKGQRKNIHTLADSLLSYYGIFRQVQ